MRPAFALSLLAAATFSCATALQSRFVAIQARNPDRDDPLAAFLGEGRRLFASHAYAKADVYLHRGFYPSIFDQHDDQAEHRHDGEHGHEGGASPLAAAAGDDGCEACCPHDRPQAVALDWIERHGRKHRPTEHVHLGGANSEPENVEREILPWLALSARLDPEQAETFMVGAFWLRKAGKPAEAERFLKDGLRANPGHPAILFELGRSRFRAGDAAQARTLWETAWRLWTVRYGALQDDDRDTQTASLILLHLATLESREGQPDKAVGWLETLLPMAVSPDRIKERIADVRAGIPLKFPETD